MFDVRSPDHSLSLPRDYSLFLWFFPSFSCTTLLVPPVRSCRPHHRSPDEVVHSLSDLSPLSLSRAHTHTQACTQHQDKSEGERKGAQSGCQWIHFSCCWDGTLMLAISPLGRTIDLIVLRVLVSASGSCLSPPPPVLLLSPPLPCSLRTDHAHTYTDTSDASSVTPVAPCVRRVPRRTLCSCKRLCY